MLLLLSYPVRMPKLDASRTLLPNSVRKKMVSHRCWNKMSTKTQQKRVQIYSHLLAKKLTNPKSRKICEMEVPQTELTDTTDSFIIERRTRFLRDLPRSNRAQRYVPPCTLLMNSHFCCRSTKWFVLYKKGTKNHLRR